MLGEIALEHDLRLGLSFGSRSSEFTDQPVLESSPQSLDSAFGLRGAGRDQGYPELLQASATSVEGRWFFNCSSRVGSLSVQKIE